MFPVVTLRLGTQEVAAYPLVLAASVLVSALLFLMLAHRRGFTPAAAWRLFGLCAVCGLVFSRLVYSMVRFDSMYYDPIDGRFLGLRPFFDPSIGGLSLFGMLLGVCIGSLIDARLAKAQAAPRLDAVAPPLAVLIAFARFGEILAGQGYGSAVETAWLRIFPIAIQDAYGDWLTAVFALEGLVVLAIAGYLLLSQRRAPLFPGGIFIRFIVALCTAQVFLESLRRDDYLRLESNGFVRIDQVFAILCLLAVTIALTYRLVKTKHGRHDILPSWFMLIIAASAALAAEFYEKLPLPIPLLYGCSAIAQLMLMLVLLRHTSIVFAVADQTQILSNHSIRKSP